MSNFFSEFKKFITRGNVMDMAVGVIVGGAFTAIVNGLSDYILKPIINWILALILGANTLSELFTFLKAVPSVDEAGVPLLDEAGNQIMDLTQSIYIDWGSFINAIINFFLIALVLFTIVRIFNRVRENNAEFKKEMAKVTKEDKAAMKKLGISRTDKAAVTAYFAAKEKAAAEAAEAAAAEAAAKAEADRLANPTTEDLLKEIRDLLKKA